MDALRAAQKALDIAKGQIDAGEESAYVKGSLTFVEAAALVSIAESLATIAKAPAVTGV